MKTNQVIVTFLIAIIVGGAGFFGGMQYQKSQVPSFGNGRFAGANRMMGGARGGATSGQVISEDASSITVKLPDGSSKIVLTSGSTQFVQSSSASASDIKTGDRVAVFGSANSDGSITATNVQINPPQRGASPIPTGASK